MNEILKVENLSISFPMKKKTVFDKTQMRQVVKNASITIYEGEIVGLLGESGCGKSTIAKAIIGMNKHYEGRIEHFSTFPQMIFQDPFGSLNPSKNVKFILTEALRNLTKKTKVEREERAKEMLEKVGLNEKYLSHYPNELSGGQRQRIAIATALMLEPKLIIADEPVSALDVTVQAQVIKLLLDLKEELGLSILFISHDLRVVYQMCDRVMVMKQGEIVESGTVEDVYQNPKHPYTKTLLATLEDGEK